MVKIQLQDDGQVPAFLVTNLKDMGYKVWGWVRPSHEPLGGDLWEPSQAVPWIAEQKRRLHLDGMDCNFEDEVRFADRNTQGQWSEEFCSLYRETMPTLPSALDTYFGAAAGGMNLGAYTKRGFRMNVQTYWGTDGLYDDPPTRIVNWCAGAQPPIPKAVVKPIIRVSPNNQGMLPDFNRILSDCVQAGTKGVQFYYVDGADSARMSSLIRDSIRTGAALR